MNVLFMEEKMTLENSNIHYIFCSVFFNCLTDNVLISLISELNHSLRGHALLQTLNPTDLCLSTYYIFKVGGVILHQFYPRQ